MSARKRSTAKRAGRVREVPDLFWIEAWALIHPALNRPMVAIDNARKLRAWGIFRTPEDATKAAMNTHKDCTVRRVFITDAWSIPDPPAPRAAQKPSMNPCFTRQYSARLLNKPRAAKGGRRK